MEETTEKSIRLLLHKYQARAIELERENERLKRQKDRLEEKLNAALDGTGLCLWEQHIPTGSLTIFNMEWGKMLGFKPNELEANVETWKSKLHPEEREAVVGAFESHLAGESDSYQAIHRMLHKDGSHSWVSDRGRIVEYSLDGKPLRMMGTHIDITQEKRYELELAKLASLDPLTNLLNRNTLEQKFNDIGRSQENKSTALIFIDLDNFKSVNDHLGHKAGDTLLIQISHWLIKDSPSSADVARLGGDEFVILCSDVSKEELTQLATQLLQRVSAPIMLENGEANVGFSIGICMFTPSTISFDDVYEQADAAMYQVKRQGKNNFVFYDALEK